MDSTTSQQSTYTQNGWKHRRLEDTTRQVGCKARVQECLSRGSRPTIWSYMLRSSKLKWCCSMRRHPTLSLSSKMSSVLVNTTTGSKRYWKHSNYKSISNNAGSHIVICKTLYLSRTLFWHVSVVQTLFWEGECSGLWDCVPQFCGPVVILSYCTTVFSRPY